MSLDHKALPKTLIHPTAIIEHGAELASDVIVGPYALIGPHVKIGKGTHIHGHALVTGHTTLGERNTVYHYASVGNPPQDLKYKDEPTELIIGDDNLIREFTTLQPGTIQGLGKTVIGNRNLFMAYVHVAHDCVIGDDNVLANTVQLAGHVTLQNMTVLGGMSAFHQHVRVGDMGMCSGGSMVGQDIPPYCIVDGHRSNLRGLNMVAMKRRGLSDEAREAIKKAYRILFLEGYGTVDDAIQRLPKEVADMAEVQKLVHFIQTSERGVCRPEAG